jgi:hypothetical protein
MLIAAAATALLAFAGDANATHRHTPFGPLGAFGSDALDTADAPEFPVSALDLAAAPDAITGDAHKSAMGDALRDATEDLHETLEDALDD